MKNIEEEQDQKTVQALYWDINIVTAALLLTGQLSMDGVFFEAGGIAIPLSGPITGGYHIEGKSGSRVGNLVIDIVDIIIAILLIIGQISIRSTIFSSGRAAVVVSGPIFGLPKTEVDLRMKEHFFRHFGNFCL
ncbi:hypothetical protein [Lederbergia citrea]|uniref:Uncharacterized protein n=1 Tax=Lederbergia citrea TaxID=2833581 RepID=A0A942UQH6_9BACI|nr:hypothetical protein [Lederbergia citrea]MBS4223083.1 hypothetical protein [Lederbergia citrea]